jgi:hypothetical protein
MSMTSMAETPALAVETDLKGYHGGDSCPGSETNAAHRNTTMNDHANCNATIDTETDDGEIDLHKEEDETTMTEDNTKTKYSCSGKRQAYKTTKIAFNAYILLLQETSTMKMNERNKDMECMRSAEAKKDSYSNHDKR